MELEEIKSKLQLAIAQFYFNERLDEELISDKEYDELASQYEKMAGKSAKTLIEYRERRVPAGYFSELDKVAIDGDFAEPIKKWLAEINEEVVMITPKYDGCSIQAIYERGRLKYVASTADQSEGIDRTLNFIDFFPEYVDPTINAIQGEVVVDANIHGELARNAANGLVNSKYKVEECKKEAYIRVYNLKINDNTVNNNDKYAVLTQCLNRYFEETNKNFNRKAISMCSVMNLDNLPNKPIWDFGDGIKTQIDGIVVYTTNHVKAFKFYYTESAVTTVRSINWNKKPNGSYAPVLSVDTVQISGKNISNVSANGVPALMSMKCGVGSTIRVILANTVIPKVHQVLETSENYQFPVCSCGYQMGHEDIYGSTLKCGADNCDAKMNLIYNNLKYHMNECLKDHEKLTFSEFVQLKFFNIINCMSIDRWSSHNKFKTSQYKLDEAIEELIKGVIIRGVDIKEYLNKYFYFSWVAGLNMEIMAVPFANAMYYIYNEFNELQEY